MLECADMRSKLQSMCSEDNIYNIFEYPAGQNIHCAARQVRNSMAEQLTDQSDSKDNSKWCYTVPVAMRISWGSIFEPDLFDVFLNCLQIGFTCILCLQCLGGNVEERLQRDHDKLETWAFFSLKEKVPDSAPAMEQPWLYAQTGG